MQSGHYFTVAITSGSNDMVILLLWWEYPTQCCVHAQES